MNKLVWPIGALCIAAGVAAVPACGARSSLWVGDLEGAGGSPPAPLTCKTGNIQLVRATPTVMFVLDRSGSMNDPLDFTGESRWDTLTSALSHALPPVNQTMSIGATFFPSEIANTHEESCTVSTSPVLGVGLGHVAELISLMKDDQPNGATPTAVALDVAATAIDSTRAATAARALVLATDGAPNCNASLDTDSCVCANPEGCHHGGPGGFNMCLDEARTVATLAKHEKAGLPTYVVGITDETDQTFNEVLNAMAVAGGRPQTNAHQQFYEARSNAEMTAAFTAIRNQVGRCTYLTTSIPDSGGTITVLLNGVEVPLDPSGATGWSWSNEANGEILFSPSACSMAASTDPSLVVAEITCAGD